MPQNYAIIETRDDGRPGINPLQSFCNKFGTPSLFAERLRLDDFVLKSRSMLCRARRMS